VRDLPPGYTEWPAPAALRHAIACLWAQVTPGGSTRRGLVLPDACADLIWEPGRGAYVAGPDTGPAPTEMPAGTIIIGVRFGPGGGGPGRGRARRAVRHRRVAAREGRRGEARRLPGTLDPDTAVVRALDVVAGLVADGAPDPALAWAAELLEDPQARTEEVAEQIGLSERQLRRRCHDAVGYGPKTLQRVLRFRRFVAQIDAAAGPPRGPARDLATIAARAGYADQAHLTRECRALAGLTPAALARQRAS